MTLEYEKMYYTRIAEGTANPPWPSPHEHGASSPESVLLLKYAAISTTRTHSRTVLCGSADWAHRGGEQSQHHQHGGT
jgi:hypothetical protein